MHGIDQTKIFSICSITDYVQPENYALWFSQTIEGSSKAPSKAILDTIQHRLHQPNDEQPNLPLGMAPHENGGSQMIKGPYQAHNEELEKYSAGAANYDVFVPGAEGSVLTCSSV